MLTNVKKLGLLSRMVRVIMPGKGVIDYRDGELAVSQKETAWSGVKKQLNLEVSRLSADKVETIGMIKKLTADVSVTTSRLSDAERVNAELGKTNTAINESLVETRRMLTSVKKQLKAVGKDHSDLTSKLTVVTKERTDAVNKVSELESQLLDLADTTGAKDTSGRLLSCPDIKKARAKVAKGALIKDVAASLNVSASVMSNALAGKTYKDCVEHDL